MTQCTRTFLGITCCMDCSTVLEEENSTDRNCIDPGDLKCNQLLFDIDNNMWLVLCALTLIGHNLLLAKLKAY